MDLIEKYKPKKINDLICNKEQVNKIKYWIKNYKYNEVKKKNKLIKSNKIEDYSCIIITGTHGIGKTVTSELIVSQMNYNCNKLKSSSKLNDLSKELSNVVSLLINKKIKEINIIDELESISSTQEKNAILNIVKQNNEIKKSPIILISNNNHNKFLSTLKSLAYEIKFYKPYDSELKQLLIKIAKEENMKFKSMEIVNTIVESAKGDIRKLILTLQDLKNNFTDKIITQDIYNKYKKNELSKYYDFNLYTCADDLLYNYTNIDDCLKNFESQTVYLPLMVHQYYCDVINKNVDNEDEKFQLMKDISQSLSTGDVIENLIFGYQNWKVREIHGFYSCVNTSYNLCNSRSEKEPNKTKLEFPKDLNKTSIKNINKKNIDNVNKCINNKTIIDYIYISKIVKQLIKNNKLEECSRLLKPHNIKLEHIESLLKIEKINYKKDTSNDKSTKLNLTFKQKKEFQNLLKN